MLSTGRGLGRDDRRWASAAVAACRPGRARRAAQRARCRGRARPAQRAAEVQQQLQQLASRSTFVGSWFQVIVVPRLPWLNSLCRPPPAAGAGPTIGAALAQREQRQQPACVAGAGRLCVVLLMCRGRKCISVPLARQRWSDLPRRIPRRSRLWAHLARIWQRLLRGDTVTTSRRQFLVSCRPRRRGRHRSRAARGAACLAGPAGSGRTLRLPDARGGQRPVPSSATFGRMFPDLPPFAKNTAPLREALLTIGAPGGMLDANDDLFWPNGGPVKLITDLSLSQLNRNNPLDTTEE